MKLEFSRQIFEKYLNIAFHENPSSGSRVVTSRRTDGQTHKYDFFFAKAPKNGNLVNSLGICGLMSAAIV